jgi:hypothetical protein
MAGNAQETLHGCWDHEKGAEMRRFMFACLPADGLIAQALCNDGATSAKGPRNADGVRFHTPRHDLLLDRVVQPVQQISRVVTVAIGTLAVAGTAGAFFSFAERGV